MTRKLYISKSIAITILLIVSFGVYANTLFNEFVYDDNVQVLGNLWIKDSSNIPAVFSSPTWAFSTENSSQSKFNYYRPMMHLIYMAEYHIFGLKPWGWHLVNIIFHAINSIMVFLITFRLFHTRMGEVIVGVPLVTTGRFGRGQATHLHSQEEQEGIIFSLIAAILFNTHPINTEVVAWVAGIPELSFTLFCLMSFYLYISQRYLLSSFFFFMAAISKETALILPIFLLVYDYACRRGIFSKRNYANYLPFIMVTGIYMFLRIYALGGMAPQRHRHDYLSSFQYFINVFPLIIQYFEKLILPINLTFHVFHPVYSILEPKTIISISLTISFLTILFLIRRVSILAFFALLWVLIPLLPVLYIPGVGENTFAERYLYLSSAGFSVLAAYLFTKALYKLEFRKMGWAIKKVLIISICIIIGLYSTGTIRRNLVWANSMVLWFDIVQKSPDSAMAHYNLGGSYYFDGQIDLAIMEFQKAIEIAPGYVDAHYNLGAVYQNKGLLKNAIEEYQEVIKLSPGSADAYYNLGLINTQSNFLDQAILSFQEAIRIKPEYQEAQKELNKVINLKKQLQR